MNSKFELWIVDGSNSETEIKEIRGANTYGECTEIANEYVLNTNEHFTIVEYSENSVINEWILSKNRVNVGELKKFLEEFDDTDEVVIDWNEFESIRGYYKCEKTGSAVLMIVEN